MLEVTETYNERNRLAVAFCKLAVMLGWNAGTYIDVGHDDWDDAWKTVVAVELPNGKQVSWHMNPETVALTASLPKFFGRWDGTYIAREVDWTDMLVEVE